MKAKRMALYIRDIGYGPSAQEQRAAAQPIADGLRLPIEEFVESSENAPGEVFARLRDNINAGSIAVVVVSSLDRLDLVATSLPAFFGFVSELAANGARFMSTSDKLDSRSPTMDFMACAREAVEQAARVIGGERIHLALKKAKSQGEPVGRRRSVDYAEIILLRRQGKTEHEIAEILGVSRGSVQHCLRQVGGLDRSPDPN